jgi:LysM repeat protein
VRHTVVRGQTLSSIAGAYGVSVNDVSAANNLRNVNQIYVGMTLVIPKHGSMPPAVASTTASAGSASKSTSTSRTTTSTYTVRKGDTLSVIATRNGTTVSAIKSRNGLRGDTIQVGQKLNLTGSASGSGSSTPAVVVSSYKVRTGDTLSSIATRFGVRTSDLQSWNGIRDASHIQVGQTLKVKGSAAQWKTYSVRSGDSLGKIASANHCSVSDLQQWNSLSGSVIHPGQKLQIRAH